MARSDAVAPKAQIPNPALEPLAFLIGDWRTAGTHPGVPGKTLIGRTSFRWHEGGAFLIMRNEVDEPGFPDGVAIFGSDGAGGFTMIYFDERGVSRVFEVEAGEGTVTWHREDPKLAQSATVTAGERSDSLVGKGRMSVNGGEWGDDLSQEFERE